MAEFGRFLNFSDLMASAARVELPEEVAFFIANRIRSNVRELKGALRRVVAKSQFTGQPITLDFAKEALRDLLHGEPDGHVSYEFGVSGTRATLGACPSGELSRASPAVSEERDRHCRACWSSFTS